MEMAEREGERPTITTLYYLLKEHRQELQDLAEQFREMNGSVKSLTAYKIDHQFEHRLVDEVGKKMTERDEQIAALTEKRKAWWQDLWKWGIGTVLAILVAGDDIATFIKDIGLGG